MSTDTCIIFDSGEIKRGKGYQRSSEYHSTFDPEGGGSTSVLSEADGEENFFCEIPITTTKICETINQ